MLKQGLEESVEPTHGLERGFVKDWPTSGRLAFLAWGDFHARSRFARPTIPQEKWGLLVV